MPHHADPPPSPGGSDPVLEQLAATAAEYQAQQAAWAQQTAELAAAQTRLAQLEAANGQLTDTLHYTREQLEAERRQAARQRDRANQFSACLKDIHGSLFSGNIYNLILKVCLTITGATRGLYLTARGPEDRLWVRAALDLEGYPHTAPSAFITALYQRALAENDTFVCNDGVPDPSLPAPATPSEQFRNYAVAPVMLLQNFDGIIIAADKPTGEFNTDDIEALLSVGDQAKIAVQNHMLQQELQNTYLSTVSMLADAVEAKDAYTHGHCEQVSRYARLTAYQMGLSDEVRNLVCYAALLHDVGKIGVSDGILNKPGPLSPEEYQVVRAHVRVGYDLLARVPALQPIAEAVLRHHERYDGTGYPDGLRGEEIPMAARIITVVDSYCAMTSRRSYKEAYDPAQARAELERGAGTQFDPEVVKAFQRMLDMPEAEDADADDDAECGPLTGYTPPLPMSLQVYH